MQMVEEEYSEEQQQQHDEHLQTLQDLPQQEVNAVGEDEEINFNFRLSEARQRQLDTPQQTGKQLLGNAVGPPANP